LVVACGVRGQRAAGRAFKQGATRARSAQTERRAAARAPTRVVAGALFGERGAIPKQGRVL